MKTSNGELRPDRKLCRAWLVFGLLLASLPVAGKAQLGADCTASLLGRTAQVNDDGSFFIANIPVESGRHRVRVTTTGTLASVPAELA